VADAAPRIVAFVNFGPLRDDDADRDSVAEVYAIYCLAEFWDRGIGRGLMEAALASLGDLDYAEVKVWVLDTNRRAIAFYRKLGFSADGAEKVEQREDYRIRELRYSRNLHDAAPPGL
jgi:ribosomal protein S18 acetylase RimI-like enzyme